MPIIDMHKETLDFVLGKKISLEKASDALFQFGMEVDSIEGDFIKVEVTPERVDMMTPEGVARALRAYMGINTGMPSYKTYKSGAVVKVDGSVKGIREFSACAIVKGLKWTD